MATLTIEVTTRRMPHSTQFHRIVRAPEHLYYALLFSVDAAYAGPDPWLSWLGMGFGLALKEAPPAAREEDKLSRSVHSTARHTVITASSLNGGILGRLSDLLQVVEDVRESVVGKGPGERVQAVTSSPEVSGLVLDPVREALANAGLRQEEAQALEAQIQRAFAALTDGDIASIDVKEG